MIPMRVLMDVETDPITHRHERDQQRPGPTQLGAVSAVGILTKGTEEGRPVVIVRIDNGDGTFTLGQTTLRLMETAVRAFMARYGDLL